MTRPSLKGLPSGTSPYRDVGLRRCSRGTLYNAAVGGCPCCRDIAARRRKLKMLPARRRCRACRKFITDLRHHNQYLHPGCREAWQEAEKDRKSKELRDRWRLEKPPGACRVAACRQPADGGAKCAKHRAMRHRQDAAAREQRKRLGICRDCRKPARPGGVYCEACVEKVRIAAARWRDRHRTEKYWLAWTRPKTWLCRDCRGPVEYDGVGRPALRCERCKEESKP